MTKLTILTFSGDNMTQVCEDECNSTVKGYVLAKSIPS